jgi:hypothetical protein
MEQQSGYTVPAQATRLIMTDEVVEQQSTPATASRISLVVLMVVVATLPQGVVPPMQQPMDRLLGIYRWFPYTEALEVPAADLMTIQGVAVAEQ